MIAAALYLTELTCPWLCANLLLDRDQYENGTVEEDLGKAIRNSENATLALNSIRTMIDSGQFPTDGRLPTERELSTTLGVGRRAVQRALEALEAEGIVWRQQGKGTFVGQPPDPTRSLAAKIVDKSDPISVMEARLAIEPSLAELCARRATADDVAKMRHLANRTAGSADSDAVELWDGALHHFMARVAGNPLLLAAFTLLDQVRIDDVWQSQRHRARSPERVAQYYQQHGSIIDAIEARDGDAARSTMTAHLKLLQENMVSAAPEFSK